MRRRSRTCSTSIESLPRTPRSGWRSPRPTRIRLTVAHSFRERLDRYAGSGGAAAPSGGGGDRAYPQLAAAEGTDSVVGAVLQTGLFGLGDIDPSSLVVTDDELLSAGQSPMPAMSFLDKVDIVVDDDRVQCPDAQFTSIQEAVAAALPGSTIRVCPGAYRENVIVPKLLTLQAVRNQGEAT